MVREFGPGIEGSIHIDSVPTLKNVPDDIEEERLNEYLLKSSRPTPDTLSVPPPPPSSEDLSRFTFHHALASLKGRIPN